MRAAADAWSRGGGPRKAEAAWREQLAHAARRGAVVAESERGRYHLRPTGQVRRIEAEVEAWRSFGARHGGGGADGGPVAWDEGGLKALSEDDRERAERLLDHWMTRLSGEQADVAWDLAPAAGRRDDPWHAALRTWGTFDLDAYADELARTRRGSRLRGAEPAIAAELLAAGRTDARGLLELRLSAARRAGDHAFPAAYDAGLVAAAEARPAVDVDAALAAGRTDLRHLPLVTIDPDDARDFDDAVALEVAVDGRHTVWVAIADVAHVVRQATSLDAEAQRRATSVYLPHTVLPMLPPRLADDLCSLRAGVPRLAMVVGLRVDDGRVTDCQAHEALIEVQQNMSYSDALPGISAGHGDLGALAAVARSMRDRRIRLATDGAELRPRLWTDDQGDLRVAIEVKRPDDATRLIETLMVAANEAVGELLGAAGAPLPWRTHPPPDRPDVDALNTRLAAIGVDVELPRPSHRTHGQSVGEAAATDLAGDLAAWAAGGGGASITLGEGMEGLADLLTEQTPSDAPSTDTPEHLREVMDPEARAALLQAITEAQQTARALGDPEARILETGLLHLLQRAAYTPENVGHFGLSSDAYVHFTSPIRRYPDLIVHRQLKSHLRGVDWAHDEADVAELCGRCTQRGREAEHLERELVAQAFSLHLWQEDEVRERGRWARVVGLRSPFITLDLNDDGALLSRVRLEQVGRRVRLFVDEHGAHVRVAEGERLEAGALAGLSAWSEEDLAGGGRVVLRLGQRVAVRIREVDVWSGELDVAVDIGR